MADKLYKTKGIVLRTVKYGETSLIVNILTELFGIQSYLINGVRKATSKSSGKAMFFQSSAILDLVVYHNDLKQLNRIKEFKWSFLYQQLFSDVKKNAIALFMIEMLSKCVRQPENHPELFFFAEDCLLHLDKSTDEVAANFPLFFALHLPVFFGLKINDDFSIKKAYLDLQEGSFKEEKPSHPHHLDQALSATTAEILRVMQPDELSAIKLHRDTRRQLLHYFEQYYALHMQDFGTLRTLPVLKELLS